MQKGRDEEHRPSVKSTSEEDIPTRGNIKFQGEYLKNTDTEYRQEPHRSLKMTAARNTGKRYRLKEPLPNKEKHT